VADKFNGCVEHTKWPSAKAEAVITIVESLETAPDTSKLVASLKS
jgi:hypothetical protein